MSELLHELVAGSANRTPERDALIHNSVKYTFNTLATRIDRFAAAAISMGLGRQERVGIYLPKQPEAVIAMFGAAAAGAVFVPINPLLKAEQVSYILQDCNVRILITSAERAASLAPVLPRCHDLRGVVLTGDAAEEPWLHRSDVPTVAWNDLMTSSGGEKARHRVIDGDMAAILYTSGSTGKPKGVVLSHRNMVTGAKSVASYLANNRDDRLLAVLPFSFDYGFSQLSTAYTVGAGVVLLDYLLPRDVVRTVERERITGLAGVPPLWAQLAQLDWPHAVSEHLRYITNSGGAMPGATLQALRQKLPRTQPFLMYGLTEAFRSTFLPPAEIDNRPGSMGKAIPNVEIMVVREDGSSCAPGEPGELVHRGALVSLGYWNDPEKTAERFRAAPAQNPALTLPEIAVWSGDTVRSDEDGYLYFVGRRDDMIKTSGYRVSPTEIEEVVYSTGLVAEASAIGVPHPVLGQAIILVAKPSAERTRHPRDDAEILDACKRRLANFMVPQRIEWRSELPRNPNGKIDRKRLVGEHQDLFQEDGK